MATLWWTTTYAIPTITFPLNSQVPPIARISEPFSYTFSQSTFSSDLTLQYILSTGPNWLSLDSGSRTLSGTPSLGDVGADTITGVNIGLTAVDSTGSVTLDAIIVISRNPAPVVNILAEAQLTAFASFSAPSTFLYHPSSPFIFDFNPATFLVNGSSIGLEYYAITTDNTPLPSWLSFEQNTLSFSGTTPEYASLIQPPQTFSIQLVASDVVGFSGTSVVFSIEVGVHLFAFNNSNLSISTTAGTQLDFDGLAGSLELDGQSADSSHVATISAQTTSWLAFDNSSLHLSGTVPSDATPFTVTVQATDIYGDSASTSIYVNVTMTTSTADIFAKQITTLNITSGSYFSYDLSTYLNNKADTIMTASFSPSQSWITFNTQTFIMAGLVPPNTNPYSIQTTLDATSRSLGTASSQTFKLMVNSADIVPTSTMITTVKQPTHTSMVSSPSKTNNTTLVPLSTSKPVSKTIIILATIIPLSILILVLLAALFCCLYRRRKARNNHTLQKHEISAPLEAPSPNLSTVSIVEITRPATPIPPPPPLQLNMSGFAVNEVGESPRKEKVIAPNRNPVRAEPISEMDNHSDLRRSQTLSGASDPRIAELRQSDYSGHRVRSYSENNISRREKSWLSAQDSAATNSQSSGANSVSTQKKLSRHYSNYSRKGHTRRSANVTIIGPVKETPLSSSPVEDSILGLRNSDFSFTPLDHFSALPKPLNTPPKESAPDGSEFSYVSRPRPTKRQSRLTKIVGRPLSGIGHGGRESIPSTLGLDVKRRSIGHGKDWPTQQGNNRNSITWLTASNMTAAENGEKRNITNVSASIYSQDEAQEAQDKRTIRAVTKSPKLMSSPRLSEGSDSYTGIRPVSRRVGSPFFFGGSSTRRASRSTKHVRTSFADSPTVPEEAVMGDTLEQSIQQGLRQNTGETTGTRDSFGISYGMAREGTRQLRSYIQNQLHRSRTKGSIMSMTSKDSRFESASASMYSLPLDQTYHSAREDRNADNHNAEEHLDDFSEGSWETQFADSEGNVVQHASSDVPPLPTAQPVTTGQTSASNSHVPLRLNARTLSSRGKRPVSVDTRTRQTSVKGKMETGGTDYTAYI